MPSIIAGSAWRIVQNYRLRSNCAHLTKEGGSMAKVLILHPANVLHNPPSQAPNSTPRHTVAPARIKMDFQPKTRTTISDPISPTEVHSNLMPLIRDLIEPDSGSELLSDVTQRGPSQCKCCVGPIWLLGMMAGLLSL